ncbi:hypothetical protein BU17DRAFT_88219 [Hysterangium stoloniferum]|nr:hypothetical protein BU17DRAFT_88219 [Hysterangium stoloniferum]
MASAASAFVALINARPRFERSALVYKEIANILEEMGRDARQVQDNATVRDRDRCPDLKSAGRALATSNNTTTTHPDITLLNVSVLLQIIGLPWLSPFHHILPYMPESGSYPMLSKAPSRDPSGAWPQPLRLDLYKAIDARLAAATAHRPASLIYLDKANFLRALINIVSSSQGTRTTLT